MTDVCVLTNRATKSLSDFGSNIRTLSVDVC